MNIKPDNSLTPFIQRATSPLGDLYLGASESGLKYVKLMNGQAIRENPNTITDETAQQLKAYFDGQLKTFKIDFDLEGYSEFSQKVWKQLVQIPYGQTISYMQLALKLGDAKCIRAAGTANGRNPIPIIIPCHRVIGSDGSLTGFALGLEVKRQLLALENPNKYNVKQISLF